MEEYLPLPPGSFIRKISPPVPRSTGDASAPRQGGGIGNRKRGIAFPLFQPVEEEDPKNPIEYISGEEHNTVFYYPNHRVYDVYRRMLPTFFPNRTDIDQIINDSIMEVVSEEVCQRIMVSLTFKKLGRLKISQWEKSVSTESLGILVAGYQSFCFLMKENLKRKIRTMAA